MLAISLFFTFVNKEQKSILGASLALLAGFVGLFSILMWSTDFLLVFLLSELLFLFIVFKSKESQKLHAKLLEGFLSFFSLLGCILIFGSASLFLGEEASMSLADLKSIAPDLYGANYFYSSGCIFVVAPLLYRLGGASFLSLSFEKKKFDLVFLLFKGTAILTLLKYSTAGFFTVSSNMQILIQWCFVISGLYLALSSFSEGSFSRKLQKWIELQVLMVVFSLLAFMFDGEGELKQAFHLFFQMSLFAVIAMGLNFYLEKFKKSPLSMVDFYGLSSKAPGFSIVLSLSLLSLSSFPLFLTFYARLFLLKTNLETGFYWVSFWSLFISVLCWLSVVQFLLNVYLNKFRLSHWVLWENKALRDFSKLRAVWMSLGVLVAPLWMFIYQ
jgi:hypothetical protein